MFCEASFEEQIFMSKEMEVIVIIHVILQIFFATHIVLKIKGIPQFKLRHIKSCD